ncbi:regulatory protein RecX [Flavobacterium chuncheonense]|uniref:Regulatory protein RecX n=1 Tax=Flavobacterium chuncheonense TaxID=2026653 RepID=A0ABW5YLU9_9FLAO
MKKNNTLTLNDIKNKLEHYCAYQERCYKEVEDKLFSFNLNQEEKETILISLIENNFINEERFAKSFVRGKHHYKNWGKVRIVNELKFRNISSRLIETALKEIDSDLYFNHFNQLADKQWENLKEPKGQKRNKKFVDFLIRKGYESQFIYDKLNELNSQK